MIQGSLSYLGSNQTTLGVGTDLKLNTSPMTAMVLKYVVLVSMKACLLLPIKFKLKGEALIALRRYMATKRKRHHFLKGGHKLT